MLDSVIRDWLEPSPLHPLRAMSGNMWALHPSCILRSQASPRVCRSISQGPSLLPLDRTKIIYTSLGSTFGHMTYSRTNETSTYLLTI
jgi:hypothetical protein